MKNVTRRGAQEGRRVTRSRAPPPHARAGRTQSRTGGGGSGAGATRAVGFARTKGAGATAAGWATTGAGATRAVCFVARGIGATRAVRGGISGVGGSQQPSASTLDGGVTTVAAGVGGPSSAGAGATSADRSTNAAGGPGRRTSGDVSGSSSPASSTTRRSEDDARDARSRAATSARRRRRTASRGAGTAAGRAGLGSRGEYLGRGDFRGRGGVFGRAGVACVTCAGSGLRRLQSDAGPAAASSTRGVAMGVRSGRGVARSAWAWRPVSTGAGRRFSIGGNRTAGPSRGVAAGPSSPPPRRVAGPVGDEHAQQLRVLGGEVQQLLALLAAVLGRGRRRGRRGAVRGRRRRGHCASRWRLVQISCRGASDDSAFVDVRRGAQRSGDARESGGVLRACRVACVAVA